MKSRVLSQQSAQLVSGITSSVVLDRALQIDEKTNFKLKLTDSHIVGIPENKHSVNFLFV